MAKKSTDKKEDFIRTLSMMSDTEINNYIKRHGKGPKPVVMCYLVDKKKEEDKANENIL